MAPKKKLSNLSGIGLRFKLGTTSPLTQVWDKKSSTVRIQKLVSPVSILPDPYPLSCSTSSYFVKAYRLYLDPLNIYKVPKS